MSDPTVLKAKGLTKTYTDAHKKLPVLSNLDFEVKAGELIAVVGASGSGKSTLLHCLGGLDKMDAGEVSWADTPIQTLSENKRAMLRNKTLGFVYQFHHLLNEFTALENVALPLLIQGQSVAFATERAQDLLKRVGLSERSEHKPGELSGGERQRVALARALVCEPKCVLADEPTGNLDRKTAQDMLDLMVKLNQDLNISFVVVTHDTHIAQCMHKTVTLQDGVLA